MGYLITDQYDTWFTTRKSMKMTEVDRLLSMTESHFGVTLVGETLIEEKLAKWGEKKKEESSTSDEAEEILGETQTKLKSYDVRQPRLPGSHLGPALEREPQFPGR